MAAQQTQMELAAGMGIGQDAISRSEGRSDVPALDLTAGRRGDPVYCESDQAPEGAIRSISVTESTA